MVAVSGYLRTEINEKSREWRNEDQQRCIIGPSIVYLGYGVRCRSRMFTFHQSRLQITNSSILQAFA